MPSLQHCVSNSQFVWIESDETARSLLRLLLFIHTITCTKTLLLEPIMNFKKHSTCDRETKRATTKAQGVVDAFSLCGLIPLRVTIVFSFRNGPKLEIMPGSFN